MYYVLVYDAFQKAIFLITLKKHYFLLFIGHKLQGRTIKDQDIVVHGSPKLDYGEGYVMLSRCKNLEQVFLDKSFIPEKHLKVHPESLSEVRNLEKRCIAAKLKKKSFDMFYANMRSKNNFIEVKNDPMAKQSSLVCLVQTCLNSNERDFVWADEEGMRVSMPHASVGTGKGVGVISDGKQEAQFKKKIQTDDFQIVQLTLRNKFQVFVLYISPNVSPKVFEDVAKAIEDMLLQGLQPIIIGDTNFNSGMKNPLSHYLTLELGLKQIIKESTYERGQNTIDHIYIRPEFEDKIKVDYRFNYYSDHISFNLCFE